MCEIIFHSLSVFNVVFFGALIGWKHFIHYDLLLFPDVSIHDVTTDIISHCHHKIMT